MNSKLFEKTFDLRTSHIYGGGELTFRECAEATTYDECTDTRTTSWDDNGNKEVCTMYDCPDQP